MFKSNSKTDLKTLPITIYTKMSSFMKLATITALVGEIIAIDKDTYCLNVELDYLISHLTNYKKTCEEVSIPEPVVAEEVEKPVEKTEKKVENPMCASCAKNPSAKKEEDSDCYGCVGENNCSCKNPHYWNLCELCFAEEEGEEYLCGVCDKFNRSDFEDKYGDDFVFPKSLECCECVECLECSDLYAIDDTRQDKYDDCYCEGCFRDKYVVCDCCMEDFDKEEDDCVIVTLYQEDDNKVSKFVMKNEWCFDCFKEEEKKYGLTDGKKGEYVEYWYGGNLSKKEDLEDYQKYCVPLSKDAPNCEECEDNWHNVAEYWWGEVRSEKWLLCGECVKKDSTYQKCE